MALVLIFLALIFLWGRREDGYHHKEYNSMDALAPALAVGAMNNQKCGGGCNTGGCCDPCNFNATNHMWDLERDMMREFAQTRTEVKDNAYTQSMDNARYFYENRTATDRGFYDQARLTDQVRYDTGLGFKDSAILALQNTKELLFAQSEGFRKIEDRLNRSEIDMLKEKLAEERMKVPRPAYVPNYGAPYLPAPQYCYADGHNAPNYGYC